MLRGVSWHMVLPWIKISGQPEFRKASRYWLTEAVWILLFTFFWLVDETIWLGFFSLKDVSACFGNILILQGYLMGYNIVFQVWQGFINVSKSFSYKDSLFILATIRKEDFRINSSFRSNFLVYLKLKGGKSNSSIFRMLIFGFLLFLLFSS